MDELQNLVDESEEDALKASKVSPPVSSIPSRRAAAQHPKSASIASIKTLSGESPSMWSSLEDDGIQQDALAERTGRTRVRPVIARPAVDGPKTLQNVMYPVGWLVVTDGPGRGRSFALHKGVSTIGTDPGETIPLAFGDKEIATTNHASVAYDAAVNAFFIGHGGKQSIVRVNGKPVLSTEPLETHSQIVIGGTTLTFVALCNTAFNWDGAPTD